MSKNTFTAETTAKLITLNAKLYSVEKGYPVIRYKFTRNTLRQLSRRKSLRKDFIQDLIEEMAELNWVLFENNEDLFCAMSMSKTEEWVKLSDKRLSHLSPGDVERICEAAIDE